MFIYSAVDKDLAEPTQTLEAFVSATSLRRHTDREIALVTNNKVLAGQIAVLEHNPFNRIELASATQHAKLQKITSIDRLCSGSKVFLASDTLVFDSIDRVFSFSEFEVAGVVALGRGYIRSIDDAATRELKQKYSLDSGVLFIRENFVLDLVMAWSEKLTMLLRKQGEAAFDQAALKRALNALEPEVLTLPHNYNFRAAAGGTLSGKCFIMRGHFKEQMERIAENGLDAELVNDFIDQAAVINDSLIVSNFAPSEAIDVTMLERKPMPWQP